MKLRSFLILSLFFASLHASAQTPQIRVGFIAGFSGPAQAYGDASRNGFELALSQFGDGRIKVTYEDDQFTPSKTVSAFKKLTAENKIDVVVCVGSGSCNAIAPLAQAQKIALVGWASDRKVSLNRSFVLRSYPSGETEGKRALEEAKSRGFSKIGLLSAIHDYPLSWKAGVVATATPGMIALDQEVPGELQDFKPYLLKARERGIKDFLLCLGPGQSGLFAKQARELHLTPRIGGCEFLTDENELKVAEGSLAGAWAITIAVSRDFRSIYSKRFGNENILSGAAIHYDLANLLHRLAMEDSASEIIPRLLKIGDYQGAAGPLAARFVGEDRYFDYDLVAKPIG